MAAEIRVMTMNTPYDNGNIESLARLIDTAGADVVALQETNIEKLNIMSSVLKASGWLTRGLGAAAPLANPQMHYQRKTFNTSPPTTTDSPYMQVIFARIYLANRGWAPIGPAGVGASGDPVLDDRNSRIIVWATITAPGGGSAIVSGTQPSPGAPQFLANALARANNANVKVAMGDFNVAWANPLPPLLVDWYAAFNECDPAHSPTAPATAPTQKIDYIFARKSSGITFKPGSLAIYQDKGSDHRLVATTIVVP